MKPRWLPTWGPVVGYYLLIFVLSSQTILTAPGASDKVAHLIEYSVLGWLWVRAAGKTWSVWSPWGLLLSTLLFTGIAGASDEWHQAYVPGRFSTVSDAVADLCGGTLGGIGYLSWLRSRDKKQAFSRQRSGEKGRKDEKVKRKA